MKNIFENAIALLCVLILGQSPAIRAQELRVDPDTIELRATERLAFESGLRTVAVKRDREGNYYVLSMRDRLVWMYNKDFIPRGHIGGIGRGPADLELPRDLAVMPDGRVVVADWGGNAVKVYLPNGVLSSSFAFRRPWSVGILSTGEILVSGFPREHLVSVFAENGEFLRSFGDPVLADEHSNRNAVLNVGRIVVDHEDNVNYVFIHLPTPTIRRYTRNGELVSELHPEGTRLQQAIDIAKETLDTSRAEGRLGVSGVLNSLGVDEETGEVWISCTGIIYRIGADGKKRGVYLFRHPDGYPINADHILVERNRLIVTSSIHGVFATRKPAYDGIGR